MPTADERNEIARRVLVLLIGVTLGALWMHVLLADDEEKPKCSD